VTMESEHLRGRQGQLLHCVCVCLLCAIGVQSDGADNGDPFTKFVLTNGLTAAIVPVKVWNAWT